MHGFAKAKALEEALRARGLDGILVMSPENVFYLSGAMINSQRLIPERLATVVWPASGPAAMVVCDLEEAITRRQSWIQDIRLYNEFSDGPIRGIATVLDERAVVAGRIGIEERFLTRRYAAELARALPQAELVAVDDLFDDLRLEKLPWEIERLRQAAKVLEGAIVHAAVAARAGMTERAVAVRMLRSAVTAGGAGFSLLQAVVASGPNAHVTHYGIGDRVLEQGDLLRLGCRGIYQAYHGIVVRTAVVGQGTSKQRAIYQDLHAIHSEVIKHLRPGVAASDAYRLSEALYNDRGYALPLPHVGHSVGLALQERPKMHPHGTTIFASDAVCVIVHVISHVELGRFYLEDMVHITQDGPVELSQSSRYPELLETAKFAGGGGR